MVDDLIIQKYGETISPYIELSMKNDEFLYRGAVTSLRIKPHSNGIDIVKGDNFIESLVTFEFGKINSHITAYVILPSTGSVDSSDYWDYFYETLSKSEIKFNILNIHNQMEWYFYTAMTLVFENEEDMLTACLMIND